MRLKGRDEVGAYMIILASPLTLPIHGLMFMIMTQESQKQLQMRRATFCFLLDVFLLDTSQDKTLVLEGVLS